MSTGDGRVIVIIRSDASSTWHQTSSFRDVAAARRAFLHDPENSARRLHGYRVSGTCWIAEVRDAHGALRQA